MTEPKLSPKEEAKCRELATRNFTPDTVGMIWCEAALRSLLLASKEKAAIVVCKRCRTGDFLLEDGYHFSIDPAGNRYHFTLCAGEAIRKADFGDMLDEVKNG